MASANKDPLTSQSALEALCKRDYIDPKPIGLRQALLGTLVGLPTTILLSYAYLKLSQINGGPAIVSWFQEFFHASSYSFDHGSIFGTMPLPQLLGVPGLAAAALADAYFSGSAIAEGLVRLLNKPDEAQEKLYTCRNGRFINNPTGFDLRRGTQLVPVQSYEDFLLAARKDFPQQAFINGISVKAEEAVQEVRNYEPEEDEKPTEDDYTGSEYTLRMIVAVNGFEFLIKTETEDSKFISSLSKLGPGDLIWARGNVYKSRIKADQGMYVLDIEQFDRAL
jgi:hypothetical protein